ncbi:uncharacterized protein LOC104918498 isoform X2 [Larimichthys crocea]|nr:uncharacterized protein LOC104918498 isoform X2 [Larimichthys crocea]
MMGFSVLLVGVKEDIPDIFTITFTDGPFSRCLITVFKITCSQLCYALEISTLVLFCVDDPVSVTLVALVSVAILINIIELIIISLPLGPSHELKEMCDLADKLSLSVIHTGPITAVVVMVVLEIERKESWLPRVMIAYVVWIFLFVIWVFILNVYKNTKLGIRQLGRSHSVKWRQQKKKELSACEVIVIAVSLIFDVGTMIFTAAIIFGIFKG